MKKNLITSLLILSVTICFSQTFNNQRMDSLFQALEKNNKFMGSLAVSQNGKLLYAKAIGYSDIENAKKADIKTKYKIGSISKMFTASLTFKAIEENKLTLNQTLDVYYPQIENSKKITIENLLNHRSGIHNFTNDEYCRSDAFNTKPKSEIEMIEIISKFKSDFEPNSKAEYSNSNYVILSYILEKIYKKPYSAVLDSKIVKPLGLKNTYFGGPIKIQNDEAYSYHFNDKWEKAIETDPSIPMGAGAIVSNPTDLTIFIEQLFKNKIVSEKSLALMKTINQNFGMGMFQFPSAEHKSYGHTGGVDDFRSILTYYPDEKLSVAITSNGVVYSNNSILLCALSSYFNTPFVIPTFKVLNLEPEVLDLYTGQYSSSQIPIKIDITRNENKLFGQATGQAAFPLEATEKTIFKFEQAGVVIEFNVDKKQLILKQGGKEFIFTK
ncbi:beta-lactamase family protein [Flavobacterium sp. F-65]|uniref:Beta-lactamase family protein n=1 Tax=Flavobacterium pisciphilum TaxID=2893755 RepID=A0ABS8MMY4_9FLAO|nr:serine hydrolase domain-containing protein [Flavobacterium sp. F-65]MCC9070131.1 beta-lactamase family protein [Flavobacterium sp. F-65]